MTPSVSPEADRELTEGAVFYAREADAEVGLALFWNTKEHWRFCAGTPDCGRLGVNARNARQLRHSFVRHPQALRNWRTSDALDRSRSRCCLHRGHAVRCL